MVEELADLLGGLVVRLVLGGHPHLGRLLDDLLADGVDAGVELRDGARALGSRLRLLGQLGIQLLKALHGAPAYGPCSRVPDGAHVVATARRATTVATAADAASWPLSSAEPGSPARSSAWASSSHVSTPKPIGVPVRTETSVMPTVAHATGSSNVPGTRTTSTCVTAASARPRRAPSRRPSMTMSCQLAATTATRSPVPSVLMVGAPSFMPSPCRAGRWGPGCHGPCARAWS